jgi:hypothetical protein
VAVEQITVSVDREVAEAYRCASEDERRKLDILVSMRLREATRSAQSLEEVAREINKNSQQRGLTPEILQSILEE